MKKPNLFLYLLTFIAGLLVVQSCNNDIDPITFDVPDVPVETIYKINVNFNRTDGKSISGITLRIEGPTTTTANVTGNSFEFSDVSPGTYTLLASKDGFIGSDRTIVVRPQEGENIYEVDMSLTEKRVPVVINNETGGSITVAPAIAGGTGPQSKPVVVTIPPGALSGEGTTSISVTPVPAAPEKATDDAAAQITSEDGTGESTVSDIVVTSFVFEPSGLKFDVPISVTVPLDISSNLANDIPYIAVYAVVDPSTGKLVSSNDPSDRVPMEIAADGSTGTMKISHFSTWQVLPDISLRYKFEKSQEVRYSSPSCGAALVRTYQRAGNIGRIFSTFFAIPNELRRVEIIREINIPAREDFQWAANVAHLEITVTVLSGSTVREEFKIPDVGHPVNVEVDLRNCHNSGGG